MKMKIWESMIGFVLVTAVAVSIAAGCSGSSEANKAEANKPAPPANEKTVPGAPTSAEAK